MDLLKIEKIREITTRIENLINIKSKLEKTIKVLEEPKGIFGEFYVETPTRPLTTQDQKNQAWMDLEVKVTNKNRNHFKEIFKNELSIVELKLEGHTQELEHLGVR